MTFVLDRSSITSMATKKTKKKNPAAVALGRLGGKRSGERRMESVSPEKRREVARKAALTRWRKPK